MGGVGFPGVIGCQQASGRLNLCSPNRLINPITIPQGGFVEAVGVAFQDTGYPGGAVGDHVHGPPVRSANPVLAKGVGAAKDVTRVAAVEQDRRVLSFIAITQLVVRCRSDININAHGRRVAEEGDQRHPLVHLFRNVDQFGGVVGFLRERRHLSPQKVAGSHLFKIVYVAAKGSKFFGRYSTADMEQPLLPQGTSSVGGLVIFRQCASFFFLHFVQITGYVGRVARVDSSGGQPRRDAIAGAQTSRKYCIRTRKPAGGHVVNRFGNGRVAAVVVVVNGEPLANQQQILRFPLREQIAAEATNGQRADFSVAKLVIKLINVYVLRPVIAPLGRTAVRLVRGDRVAVASARLAQGRVTDHPEGRGRIDGSKLHPPGEGRAFCLAQLQTPGRNCVGHHGG